MMRTKAYSLDQSFPSNKKSPYASKRSAILIDVSPPKVLHDDTKNISVQDTEN
jgi:hypothetical protein